MNAAAEGNLSGPGTYQGMVIVRVARGHALRSVVGTSSFRGRASPEIRAQFR